MAQDKKRFMIRYTKDGASTITAVSNYSELIDLLKGSALESVIETKISDNMPTVMHNEIAAHNAKVKKRFIFSTYIKP